MVSAIVVDDEPDHIDTVTTLLQEGGIKVIGKAEDGEVASQLYFRLKPDVIILDLNMPNYDGHYAIEKIKQQDPNAKIIVLSGYLDTSFEASRVSAVFSKPYEMLDVIKEIKNITNF